MTYIDNIIIPFDSCDPAGVLFYGNIFNLSHRNIEKFICESGITWEQWFKNPEWIIPIVHTEAKYTAPLFPNKEIEARTQIVKLGNSSIKFETQFFDMNNLCASVYSTHVFVNKKTNKIKQIPKEIKSKFTA